MSPAGPRRMRRAKHQYSCEARTLEVAAAEVQAHRGSVAPGASVAQAPAPLPPQIALSKSGRCGHETRARVKPGLTALVEERSALGVAGGTPSPFF